MMIRLLLDQPGIAVQCQHTNPAALGNMQIPGLDFLNELFQFCLAKPDANTAHVLEYFREHPQSKNLSKLLSWEYAEENQVMVFKDSFAKLLDWHFKSRMDELLSKSRLGNLSVDEKQELNLLVKEQK